MNYRERRIPYRSEKPRNIVLFWKPMGRYGFLSNWSAHSFVDDETSIRFQTVEHYIMYKKALLFKDYEIAEDVLEKAQTSFEAQKLGRLVQGFDKTIWDEHKEDIVFEALRMKTEQNPSIKRELLKTTGMLIAEASPYDRVWGIGLSEDNPFAQFSDKWRGSNLLGKLWMRVRGLNWRVR